MTIQGAAGAVQGIANTTQSGLGAVTRPQNKSFFAQLKPASIGGIPFVVLTGSSSFGRRNAVHEYPFRDLPWVEDLGRSARRINVTGYLVGDDVIAQRDALLKVCEAPGDQTLVHPTLGKRFVAVMDVTTQEQWDEGRVFRLDFKFIEQGKREYPTATANSSKQAATAAAGVNASAALTFADALRSNLSELTKGVAYANAVAQQGAAWAKQALEVTNDATSLFNLAASLPGQFGRLLGQTSGLPGSKVALLGASLTVESLVGAAAAARLLVQTAITAFNNAGTSLGVSTAAAYATAAQGVASAVANAASTPRDALQGLIKLASFQPELDAVSPVAEGYAGNMLRRAAIAQMIVAATQYQAASSDEAAEVRSQVLAVFDAEITIAGDVGDDDFYASMRTARALVVSALNAQGASLPTLTTVTTKRSLPSLALAQRLYRDSTRADELVARADPPHPAFMPLSFKALSS